MATGKKSCAEILTNLQALKKELEKVKTVKFKGLNVFDMAGLTRQETKHSKFLTNLFNPKYKHKFGNEFINLFLERLYCYNTKPDKLTPFPKQNKEILSQQNGGGSTTPDDKQIQIIQSLFSNILNIKSEYYINGTKAATGGVRFIDILIESDQAVLIIENKIGTNAHTNQLDAYQTYANANYNGKKKIYAFLSPSGLLPYDEGPPKTYNEGWCVVDYGSIKNIIEEIIQNVKKDKYGHSKGLEKNKIKIILEDYLEMISSEILRTNPDVLELAQDIAQSLMEEYQLIGDYLDTATLDKVRAYCSKSLGAKDGKVSGFATQEIEDFFERYDGEDKYHFKLAKIVIQNVGGNKGIVGYEILIQLLKPQNGQWTKAQSKLLPDSTGQDRAVMKVTLLPKEKVGCKFDDIISELDSNLQIFKNELKKLKSL